MEAEHFGKIALLHNGDVVDAYEDRESAYEAGVDRYGLGKFSFEEIGAQPIFVSLLLWGQERSMTCRFRCGTGRFWPKSWSQPRLLSQRAGSSVWSTQEAKDPQFRCEQSKRSVSRRTQSNTSR